MNICVMIPCFNEERMIGTLVSGLCRKNLPVVVVDDGSTDQSVHIAKASGAHVLEQGKNYGKGHTIKTGIQYVLASSYDGVLMMDGDGQHAVEDVDVFLQQIKQNPEAVINGNRMRNPDNMPWIRVQTNRFMSMVISWAAGQRIPDTQCGFRYVSRKAFEKIQLETEGFEIETEILIKAAKAGFDIISIPIQTIYGNEQSNIRPGRDTLRFLRYYLKEIRSSKHS